MLLAVGAAAQTPARVVLVTSDPSASSTRRLEAELLDLGVEVRIIEPELNEPVGRATLEELARQAGAFAAIRIVPVAAEVEVWVADRVTGKTVVREILHGSGDQANFDDAIAVGAVELLRASLLEVAATEHLQGEVPPPKVVERIVPPPEKTEAVEEPERGSATEESTPHTDESTRQLELPVPTRLGPPVLAIALEPALDLGLDGLPHGVAGQVLARTRLAGGFEGEFAGVFPISPARLERGSGASEVSPRWFALSGVWSPDFSGIMPLVGVGIAAIRVEAWGDAVAPYQGQRQHVWVAAPVARAGLALALSSAFRFRVDADAAFTLKPVPIRYAGEQVASWGRPAVLLGAGLEAALDLAAE